MEGNVTINPILLAVLMIIIVTAIGAITVMVIAGLGPYGIPHDEDGF